MSISFDGAIIHYTREINSDQMNRSIHAAVTHEIRSYRAIQNVFENSLKPFDPFLEIIPNSKSLLDDGIDQWVGEFTVYTNIDHNSVNKAASKIFELSKFKPLADQGIQDCYSIKFEDVSNPEDESLIGLNYSSFRITLEGFKLKSLKAETLIKLPIEPKSREAPLSARAPLPKPENPDFTELAANLAAKQANIDRIRELTTKYLEAAGDMTAEIGEHLNQANWHTILRSMGYVAGGAGFAALGIGGCLGPILEGIAVAARATGATVTFYDTVQSDETQRVAAEIRRALEFEFNEYFQPSTPRQAELTAGEPAERVEASQEVEGSWVLLQNEGLEAGGDSNMASENILEQTTETN